MVVASCLQNFFDMIKIFYIMCMDCLHKCPNLRLLYTEVKNPKFLATWFIIGAQRYLMNEL